MKSRSKSTNKPDTELVENETLNGLNYSSYEKKIVISLHRDLVTNQTKTVLKK